MAILDEKGLSGAVKRLLDLVFFGGIAITATLPISLKWAFAFRFTYDENYFFLLGFLFFTGVLALLILHEMRRIFKMLNRRDPFNMDNVKSLKRIGIASFIIAGAYFVKIIFYISILTIIMSMLFVIIGLFSVILAEVFYQAVIVKEENDLTI